MGITVKGDEALEVLKLLGMMDEGYVPTEEEETYLGQIETLDAYDMHRDYSADECNKYDDTLFSFNINISGYGEYYFISLKRLPESIEKLSNLQVLDLHHTQISTLPDSIGNLFNLQVLDLSDTQIGTLPDSIGNLVSLQQLNLSQTKICDLPECIGDLSNLQELDLSATKIGVLPEFINNLSNLQRLSLYYTQISTLPDFIGGLTNLRKLDLSDTQISTLPNSIGNLVSLQQLNLSRTKISDLPECIGNLSNLQELDLSETRISTLPDSVGHLVSLQQLNLSRTEISILPERIGNLTNLQTLDLLRTKISAMPKSIGDLANLHSLDLSWTNICTLPTSIGNLTNLQALNLSRTEINALPECISKLTSLQELNLFHTQISALTNSIGDLANLHSLDLSWTNICTLPTSIGNLTNLQTLNLSNSRISVLPDSIGNLTNLQMLDLCDGKLSTLPESIGGLTNLQELNLSNTEVIEIPEVIGNLTNLKKLNFSISEIRSLPECIGYLTNLQKLTLSYAQIYTLPESLGNLSNLQMLDLSQMQLQKIPQPLFELGLDFEFDEYSWLEGINLFNTTLSTQPISLFHQPRKLIQAYYDATKVTINDAKVIFLGDGGVGKTRTIKRLLNGGEPGDYPTELTPGIEINDYSTAYDGHPIDLRIWDFGGQEIMHAMHRCFLTDRTCYVVMVSNRYGNRTQRARYWLKTIDSFAKNCPVILAVNLWDTDEGIDGVNGELLAEEFPNVKKIITYSAKGSDKDHFNRLTEAIVEQANRLDSCGMEFPESWANIRADLSKRAETERYISKADYLSICAKNGETDPQICGWLLEWFNDLGVCFSYHTDKTSGQELENYQVLDPKWLVNAVYLIINKGGIFAQQGVLTLEGVWNILMSGGGTNAGAVYMEPECAYILEVMRKFRLSYPNNDKSEFIPALCPDKWKKLPQTEGWNNHVTYEMRYEYLPDSVLHRLMIYGEEKHLLEQVWSGGMELSNDFDQYHAVIYLRAEDFTLEINAYTKGNRKPWALLDALRKELEQINKDLNLNAEDVIVIKTDKQTAQFPVESVLKAVERHIPTLYAMDGGELEQYQVNDILGAAFDLEKVESEKKKAEEEKRPMSKENISCGDTYITNNYYGENNGNQYVNSTVNYTSEAAENLLRQVLDNQERVTERFMDTLLEVLRESREQPVQTLAAEVDAAPKKSRWKTFCGWLNGGVGLVANLVTIAEAIVPRLGELQQVASAFLPGL